MSPAGSSKALGIGGKNKKTQNTIGDLEGDSGAASADGAGEIPPAAVAAAAASAITAVNAAASRACGESVESHRGGAVFGDERGWPAGAVISFTVHRKLEANIHF